MIEVRANIVDRAVYVSGERCVCTISVTNLDKGPSGRHQTLAWLSAQLHCQCQFNTTLLKMPGFVRTMSSSGKGSDFVRSPPDTSFIPTKGTYFSDHLHCRYRFVCLSVRPSVCLSVCLSVNGGIFSNMNYGTIANKRLITSPYRFQVL